MASCKECLNFELCEMKNYPAPLSDSLISSSNKIEKICPKFKDKSDDSDKFDL